MHGQQNVKKVYTYIARLVIVLSTIHYSSCVLYQTLTLSVLHTVHVA